MWRAARRSQVTAASSLFALQLPPFRMALAASNTVETIGAAK